MSQKGTAVNILITDFYILFLCLLIRINNDKYVWSRIGFTPESSDVTSRKMDPTLESVDINGSVDKIAEYIV